MPLSTPTVARTPQHIRQVNFRSYERADGLWDIEGELLDTKAIDLPRPNGEGIPQGGRPHPPHAHPRHCQHPTGGASHRGGDGKPTPYKAAPPPWTPCSAWWAAAWRVAGANPSMPTWQAWRGAPICGSCCKTWPPPPFKALCRPFNCTRPASGLPGALYRLELQRPCGRPIPPAICRLDFSRRQKRCTAARAGRKSLACANPVANTTDSLAAQSPAYG